MVDVIQKRATETQVEKAALKKKVNSSRIDTGGQVEQDDWQKLLDSDLKAYAKENGFI